MALTAVEAEELVELAAERGLRADARATCSSTTRAYVR